MKKYICLLLAFVMTAGILCGCEVPVDPLAGSQNLQNNPSTQPSGTRTMPTSIPTVPATIPTQRMEEPVVYEWYGILCTGTRGYYEWPLVISSAEEMKVFETFEINYDPSSAPADLSVYDEAFFENKTLIIYPFESTFFPCEFVVTNFFRSDTGIYFLVARNDYLGWGEDGHPCCTLMFVELEDKIPEGKGVTVIKSN